MMRTKIGAAGALLACVLGSGEASAASSMPVKAGVQFWQRQCTAGVCSEFTPLGARQTVELELPAPGGSGRIGRVSTVLAEGGLGAEIEFLWPQPGDGSRSFLAVQSLVTMGGSERQFVAQCSQYHSDEVTTFSPVGACGGFLPPDENGTQREYGVTFYKP